MQEKAKGQASCGYREKANLMLMCIRKVFSMKTHICGTRVFHPIAQFAKYGRASRRDDSMR